MPDNISRLCTSAPAPQAYPNGSRRSVATYPDVLCRMDLPLPCSYPSSHRKGTCLTTSIGSSGRRTSRNLQIACPLWSAGILILISVLIFSSKRHLPILLHIHHRRRLPFSHFHVLAVRFCKGFRHNRHYAVSNPLHLF